jgi:CPA2 family monovalent cation:H+ antiporter-2
MEIPLLKDVVIIFVLAIVVVYISSRVKLPAVVGMLGTGVLAGPHALGLVNAIAEVDKLAKIGVILLLFTIGIEFSLRKLLRMKSLVLIGGLIQVGATVFAVYAATTRWLGWPAGNAIFMGFLLSLSSTAIVLKLLQERAEIESPQGRISLGILIFQDVIVVLFIILTPFLAGTAGGYTGPPVLRLAITGAALILFVLVGARYVVPAILHQVVRTRSRELFLLTVGGICFAVALAAAELSLALGAFLAGLTISESEYSHEALEHITPFRDIFTSFFFVSVGMLLDVTFLVQQPVLVVLITAGTLLLKSGIVAVTGLALGFPLRTALIAGLGLSQVGEFAFILAAVGSTHALLPPSAEQLFLAISVLTMTATPFIMAGAPAMADFLLRAPIPLRLREGFYPVKGINRPAADIFRDHLVIIGYGLNGHNVAKAAKLAGIPYAVIEANPDTVRREQARSEPVYYGDASHEAVLKRVNLAQARTVVIAIADAASTRRIAAITRKLNPHAYIIARTRYVGEMDALYNLGVNEVIPEEFETSVEIFTRVLAKYLIPRDQIAHLVTEIRADGYEMFRTQPGTISMPAADFKLDLPDIEVVSIAVAPDSSLTGKSLGELDLRNRLGMNILAIRRDCQIMINLDAGTVIQAHDELLVIGSSRDVSNVPLFL